jgi:TolA protein
VLLAAALLGVGCAKRHHVSVPELVADEFYAYQRMVVEQVMSHWRTPTTARGLTATVQFHIAADGMVGDIELLRNGSGSPGFDAAALRAVQRVVRLPAPPSNLATRFERVAIEFRS